MSEALESSFTAQDFRDALGRFVTGITVVSAFAHDGSRIGFTVNSFNSVSLSPPLVLFSVARAMERFGDFRGADAYAVNVLRADQQAISEQFAVPFADKWRDVHWRTGTFGSPILDNALAVFECAPWAEYEGGDHIICVGRVHRFDVHGDAGPLAYYRGRYADVIARDSAG